MFPAIFLARSMAALLTSSTLDAATSSNVDRLCRRRWHGIPWFEPKVRPEDVHRYRQRLADFVLEKPFRLIVADFVPVVIGQGGAFTSGTVPAGLVIEKRVVDRVG